MEKVKILTASEWYSSIYPDDDYMDWNITLAQQYANYLSDIKLKQGFDAAREKWSVTGFPTIYSDRLKWEHFTDYIKDLNS